MASRLNGIGPGAIAGTLTSIAGAVALWGWLIGPIQKDLDLLRTLAPIGRAEFEAEISEMEDDDDAITKEVAARERDADRIHSTLLERVTVLEREQAVMTERIQRCESKP